MLELGKLAGTRLVEVPREVLTESIPGKVYHLTIETKGIANEEKVARAIVANLYEKFKAKVVWIRVADGVVDIQLIGSPFVWTALIAFLPTLLAVFGVVVVLISLYSVLAAIPGWAWGLLAAGVGMILFGPTVARAIAAGFERKEVYITRRD